MSIRYQSAEFLLSVANLHQLPPDLGSEVAIVGRSNAGKSSVLNCLTHNKNLARVSKTPGRTQHINLFGITKDVRIADLPGYGYAKVPPSIKQHWEKLLDSYLRNRESLKGLILVMDIRHPLKPFDEQFLQWSAHAELPVHILLNKCDKLSKNGCLKTLLQVQKNLLTYSNPISIQLFSALNKTGTHELKDKLNQWLKEPSNPT